MRLPKIRQLTEDQKKVYLYAPTDAHVLVHGPPGTGKTLIACLRAVELQKKDVPVMLGMFNRVLAKYASNASDDGGLPSRTVMTWFREWWNSSGLPPHRNISNGIAIQASFDQNGLLKAAGARWQPQQWRPWKGGKGVWMVDPDTYFADPEAFSAWRLWHGPPAVDGMKDSIDWAASATHVLEFEDSIPDGALNLGTLLIDEGQDFPPDFYKTLRQISAIAAARGKRIAHPPRCFVLADENQQLTEENSTLQQIADTLKVAADHRYLLLDNFRNSKEVAELARAFFSDVGALPRLPKRSSERPVLNLVASQAKVVDRIRIWITNNPGKEVGVLTFDDSTRNSMAVALRDSLGQIRGRNITVQTYSWSTRQENPVDDLLFDTPDVVTVLNMQSCKGLEFDAVFIIDLHQARIGIYGPDRFRMQMFVAVSRARDWVNLMDSGRQAGYGAATAHLPGPEFLERSDGETSQGAEVPSIRVVRRKAAQIEVAPQAGPGKGDSWFSDLHKLASSKSWALTDNRASGGAVWVSGGMDLASYLEPLGLVYSQKRAAWWRK